MGKKLSNFLGAFSDGAILFPLMALLVADSGFSSVALWGFTGCTYIASGLFFRVPMPVQPLKAIAVAAVSLGASAAEVRIAGGLLGLFCLILWAADFEKKLALIPKVWVHGVQLGLGIILIRKGLEIGWASVGQVGAVEWIGYLALLSLCLTGHRKMGTSVLGLVATGGALLGLYRGFVAPANPVPSANAANLFRWKLIASLVLPQLLLTTANSVIATQDAAHKYFGEKAKRVTRSNLLASIGLGNILSAFVGGLPFCHGSGGMTAHVRGGSNHWVSNVIMGVFLVFLGLSQSLGMKAGVQYPPLLLAVLLGTVGWFHMQLATPSWQLNENRRLLIAMALIAFFSQNLIWSLVVGLVWKGLELPRRVSA